MITQNKTILKVITENLNGDAKLCVKSESKISKIIFDVVEVKTGRKFNFVFNAISNDVCEPFSIENPLLWNTSNPNLYSFTAKIETENGIEEVNGNFGFRSLQSKDGKFFLNGLPFYMRAYIRGATAHDHSNNCNLSEADFYRKNILAAKKFGFNFIRFHSVVPNETFFNVADELGIMVHLELRDPESEYNNLQEMLKTNEDLVPDEFILKVINSLYNHPSLAVYCIGNEIKNLSSSKRVLEIGSLIKTTDPSRLFLDTCAWGASHRPNVDIDVQHMSYYFPFGKHANMFEDTDNLLCCGSAHGEAVQKDYDNSKITRAIWFDIPLIAHEVCHYTAIRDYKSLKEKFAKYGTKAPWWIDEELKMIEAKGLTESFDELYQASKYFQLECWKFAYEAIRSSKLLSGFHFLQFADTDVYENSNGLVDCFDDENYIESKDFIRFNADRVLLAEISDRIFYEGEKLLATFKLSNYGEEVDTDAEFVYSFTDTNGKVYTNGTLELIDISRKGLYEICKVNIDLPKGLPSNKYVLKAQLVKDGKIVADNWWNIWVYSKVSAPYYNEFVNYSDGDINITDDISKAFAMLEEGKKVCLVYRNAWTRHLLDKSMPNPEYSFKATWNRFKPVIWDRGTNYGGLNDTEILNKYGFFTERFYDVNLSVITEDCDKVDLTDFPVKATSIISGTDKSVRDRFDAYSFCFNEPDFLYEYTFRDFSYLFELKVGKGSLLVCGLNMLGLDKKEPTTVNMANFIINYMKSPDFNPKAEISMADLKAYMKKCAEKPVKEGMMTQYWELDAEPVESLQYWTESRKYLLDQRRHKPTSDSLG